MNMSEMRGRAGEAGRFLKSLCNEHRLLILCSLTEGEKSVGELEKLLEMRQPHLSQHLTRLRESGLVKTRRVSRTIYYSLGSVPAQRVVGLLYEMFCVKDAAGVPTGITSPVNNTAKSAARVPLSSPAIPSSKRRVPTRGDKHD